MDKNKQWIIDLRHDSTTVFKEIYEAYHFKIYMFVRKFIQDSSDLEDVVQNIFIHLWNHRKNLPPDISLDAILFKTSKQEVALWYRKNKPCYSLEQEQATGKTTSNPEEITIENEKAQRILNLIDQLPERRKKIFKLSKFEEKSHQEIAFAMGMTTSAVANQISKTLKFLRYHLNTIILIISNLLLHLL